MIRRATPILAALALALLVAVTVARCVHIRSDMADFLPAGKTPAARLLAQQLRSGAATSLILIGIEGAPPAELARLSRALAAGMTRSGQFALVANGAETLDGKDAALLLSHRYLLSPVTTKAAFTVAALRADLEALLGQLQTEAAPLALRYGLADPPGAFLDLARTWIGGSAITSRDGVWFARTGNRAILLARTRANGLDLAGQDRADAALRAAFAAAHPGAARLLTSGPAVFAREAADAIRGDVQLLSAVSGLLVAALLLWRFRSLWVLGVIAVPMLLSIAAGALAVQLAFGFVHAVTLGFGMTMLGVIVDYPVLLIGHRKQGEPARDTVRRIGRAFDMAVAGAALGLTGMIFSGFPGLAQLGVFSVAGLLAGAAVTRWGLPHLIVAAGLAPVGAGDPARLLRVERLRRWRGLAALPLLAAAAVLLLRPPRLERDLANLSPVPHAARDLDAALRREIGAPDVGEVVMFRAATADAVLRQEETALPVLDQLERTGAVHGAELAARLLPSAQTQMARAAILPDAARLAASLAAAARGLPFRADAFAGFQSAIAASRTMPPLTLAALRGTLIGERLAPLIFPEDGGWVGLLVPGHVTDPAAFAAALRTLPDAVAVDIPAETSAIVTAATARAWRWLALGGAGALLALIAGLRDGGRIARVVLALAMAGLLTLAVLDLAGQSLSLISIVALQFAAGIGLDYALFFSRRQPDGQPLDEEERVRTLRTLVTCNAMTLACFALLACCRTPLLHDIGLTVATGAVAAMLCGFLFAGVVPDGAA